MEEIFRKNKESFEIGLKDVTDKKVELNVRRGNLSIDEFLVDNNFNQDKDVHVETNELYDLAREFVKLVGKMN
jgi:hypothetical protein